MVVTLGPTLGMEDTCLLLLLFPQWDCSCAIPLQVRLKPLTPQTEEEKIEYSIAAERRRMRLVHKDTLKDLLTHSPQETGTVPYSPVELPKTAHG